ncbi:MAG: tetraacyldisaccharide 4'-kinase [Lentimicrobiaceae bacterium]|nr:tetraacyldisaccharide 4'-kinase [Lentimicrobiaceae bacterium]
MYFYNVDFLGFILLPFSLLYGLVIVLRNKLFDWKILPSERFSLPVICVGNLSAGGTGKTPHVEYLIRLLDKQCTIATLSRGYGRKTRGFVFADPDSTATSIGDEPMQYVNKFSAITVAVHEKRREGIRMLLQKKPETNLVLLDDAMQHRYVTPGLTILLTDYRHLYVNDYLLPSGRLREPIKGASRADIIIVTKTPKIFSPITRRSISEKLSPKPWQNLFFSYIRYGELVPFHSTEIQPMQKKYGTIVLFAGIANCYPLQEYLKNLCEELITLQFSDHHCYSPKEMEQIKVCYHEVFSKSKIIVTTEKDAMRLKNTSLEEIIVNLPVFYLPIEVAFHKEDKEIFEEKVKDYVRKDQHHL